jgi:hypothetical protein
MWHTDLFMKRTFTRITEELRPDSVLFLGDLFDGGREWSTSESESPEERYRSYKQDYWLGEYDRFERIFFGPFASLGGTRNKGQRGRRFISSLPGNHDLGIGSGVQLPVRDRFHAYFGEGNRIDVLGNHTIVQIDAVSLTAKGQAEVGNERSAIWKPTEDFISNAKQLKARAVLEEIRTQRGLSREKFPHAIDAENQVAVPAEIDHGFADLPTILLTHVPLYRQPGTPCGPKRERSPPSKPGPDGEPLTNDPPNAISVFKGYQYQNVLAPEISTELVEKIGNISHVFSGDDHDYCEVLHRSYTGRLGAVREITVKAISWAMGVRRPGFLSVSLWNPIDERGASLAGDATIQTHLCLLPDQLGMLIWYAYMIGLTVVAVAIKAVLFPAPIQEFDQDGPVLPMSRLSQTTSEKAKREGEDRRQKSDSSQGSVSSTVLGGDSSNTLMARNPNLVSGRRGISPSGGYGIRTSSIPRQTTEDSFDDHSNGSSPTFPLNNHSASLAKNRKSSVTQPRGLKRALREMLLTIRTIAILAFSWYVYVWRNG